MHKIMLFSMLHQIVLFCAPCAKPCSFLRFVKHMSSAKSCYFLCFVARQTCRFFVHQTVQISVLRRTHVAHQTDLFLFLRAPNRACSFLCFVVHMSCTKPCSFQFCVSSCCTACPFLCSSCTNSCSFCVSSCTRSCSYRALLSGSSCATSCSFLCFIMPNHGSFSTFRRAPINCAFSQKLL